MLIEQHITPGLGLISKVVMRTARGIDKEVHEKSMFSI